VKAFFDTNVVVYAYDPDAGAKADRAHRLMEQHAHAGTLTVSTQVLQESYVNLVKKKQLEPRHAFRLVEALSANQVVPANAASVLRGLALSQRFQLSPWDGWIVQAALDAGCLVLFSEDLHAGQRFGDLEIVNPFADVVHEPRRAYAAGKRATASVARRKK
jgi:predicted nucleic acid-binding protein